MDAKQTPFLRELASSDRRTRDKSLESLTLFLRSRRDLELIELLKIWKGLFYCFYHTDKPLNQQALARELSYTLIPSLPQQMLQPFLSAFWITMSRDFHSLDRLRLDKYLYLIRCYVGVAFQLFLLNDSKVFASKSCDGGTKSGDWVSKSTNTKKRKRGMEEDVEGEWHHLRSYLAMLEEGPLCPLNFDSTGDINDSDNNNSKNRAKQGKSESRRKEANGHHSVPAGVKIPKGPDGLRYHLMDIWLDELEKFVVESKLDNGDLDSNINAERNDFAIHAKIQEEEEQLEREAAKSRLKPGTPMSLLLRPIQRLKENSPNKTVRKRASEVLADERLVQWGIITQEPYDEPNDSAGDEEWGGIDG